LRNCPVLDYDEMERKVGKKFADIRAAPPDIADKVLKKALRALYWLGVKQARLELDWCQTCLGRGYYETDGLPIGVCAPPVKRLKKQFCGCKRGRALEEMYDTLGDWKRPRSIPCCGEREIPDGKADAKAASVFRTRRHRPSDVILNPRPLTEEDRREFLTPPADPYEARWLEIPAFLRRQSNI